MTVVALAEQYKSKVDFCTIYISEAHPSDGWDMEINRKEGIDFEQPTELKERKKVAQDFRERFNHTIPILVDLINNNVQDAFCAWPERLYVVHNKRVIYRGGEGPWDYDVEELADFIAKL